MSLPSQAALDLRKIQSRRRSRSRLDLQPHNNQQSCAKSKAARSHTFNCIEIITDTTQEEERDFLEK